PQRIAELEERMEQLQKKSGLSKDEFNKLLTSNQKLSEQFPEAGEVIDDYGNIIMDTTGKLKEMTRAELDRMQIQVYNQMIEGLQVVNSEITDYEDLLGKVVKLEDDIAERKAEQRGIQDQLNQNEETREKNLERINELQEKKVDATRAEKWEYEYQIDELREKNKELLGQDKKLKTNLKTLESTLETEELTLEEQRKQRDTISDNIDKNIQNYNAYVKILETQHGINIEKGNENKSLDEAIKKRKEEVKQLEEKIEKEGDSNEEHKKAIDYLNTEIDQLEDAQINLAGINRSLDYQTNKYTEAENNLLKVNNAFERSGGLTDDNV